MPNVVRCGAVSLVFLAAGCTPVTSDTTSEAPPDPPGTVTSELRIEGNGPNAIDFDTGQIGGQNSNCGSGADGKGPTFNDVRVDRAINFSMCTPATIASVGAVRGLGDITSVPSSGFGASRAVTLGDGYVVKSSENHVFAVYVAANITAVGTGGLIGLRIKWVQLDASAGDAGAGPTLTATYDGTAICSLGWTSTAPNATGAQSTNTINVGAACSGGQVLVAFKPIPATGASAPCSTASFSTAGMPNVQCDESDAGNPAPTGTVTLSGSTGAFTTSGTCTCAANGHTATVQFQDLPMAVQ